MATSRRKRVAGVELANIAGEDDETPPGTTTALPAASSIEERRERELDDVLGELGTDMRIRVWHVIDGKAAYAGEMTGDGFTLDALMEAYGGGDKTLKFYQGRELRDTVRVSLDPTIPARSPRSKGAVLAAPPPAAMDGSAMLGAMAQSMTAIMSGVAAIMARPQEQRGTDPVLVELVKGLANRPDPTVTAVELIKSLQPTTAPAGADPFSAFEKGMSVMERLAGKGGGDDEDGVMGVVKEGVETLHTLAKGYAAGRANDGNNNGQQLHTAPRQLPAPAGASVVETPATTSTTTETVDTSNDRLWVQSARPHMATLLAFAKVLSPEAAADTIARNLTDDAFYDLVDDIGDVTEPGFGGRVAVYFPAAANLPPEWLGKVVTVLLAEYTETDETAGGGGAAADGAA